MLRHIKKIDTFSRNIIFVFLGTSLANVLNLLYQLLIAHNLSSIDFAGFSSLLAIATLFSSPLTTVQIAIAKYTAEFNAHNQPQKIQALLASLIRITLSLAVITFIIFYLLSFRITESLRISSLSSGYILALLIASYWVTPIFSGALQGLELFKWFVSQSVVSGIAKLLLAFIFIKMGFNIAGALGAFLVSGLIGIFVAIPPLRSFLSFKAIKDGIKLKEFFLFLVPVAVSSFCFIALVSVDIILVKYFFKPVEAGFYSLAQILGKIFLFLPGAIATVMFPKTAGLKAKNMSTHSALNKSLLYAAVLCVIVNLGYNIFPSFILKILTGKIFDESIMLGRLFGVSMSFFALLFILINYFLSIKDLRFIKYLILSVLMEILAIVLLHRTLIDVQLVLCVNSALLFLACLFLVYRRKAILA